MAPVLQSIVHFCISIFFKYSQCLEEACSHLHFVVFMNAQPVAE